MADTNINMDFDILYEAKFKELKKIPFEFLERAVEFLTKHIDNDTKTLIQSAFDKEGSGWLTSYHFGWGMHIRNALRKEGLKDDVLPDGNWDDYYGVIVEIACGIRDINGVVLPKANV